MYKSGSEACWARRCWSGEDLTSSKSTFSLLCVLPLGTTRLRCRISPQMITSNTTTIQENAIAIARKMLRVSGERKQTTVKPTIKHQRLLCYFVSLQSFFFSTIFTLRNTTLCFNPETWTLFQTFCCLVSWSHFIKCQKFLMPINLKSHTWPLAISNK